MSTLRDGQLARQPCTKFPIVTIDYKIESGGYTHIYVCSIVEHATNVICPLQSD